MPHHKLIARLEAVAGLSALDKANLSAVPHTIHLLDHGEHLLRLGDRPLAVSLVVNGVIARQKTVRDRNQISSFYLAGDIPDLQTLQIETVDHDLCSIGDTTIASIPHACFRDLMQQSGGSLTEVLWRDTLLQGGIYCEWVNNLGSRPALEKIAHLLCELTTRLEIVGLSKRIGERIKIELPLRQVDVAEAAGLSIVHVNRSIQELRRRGLIEWEGHTVEIIQRDRLEQISEFSSDYLYAKRAPPASDKIVSIGSRKLPSQG